MYTSKAKALTPEAFCKYGTYMNLLDNDEMAKAIFNRRYLSAEVWDGAYKSV